MIIIAACLLSLEPCLTLRDADTGKIWIRLPVRDRSEFSIEFVHSVNQTPVRDAYVISGREIQPVATYFYNFGAGMQTDLEEGQSLNHHPDGSMSITGFQQSFKQLNYIVGTVSDHVLTIDGKQVSLRELCGSNAAVTFAVEERIKIVFASQ